MLRVITMNSVYRIDELGGGRYRLEKLHARDGSTSGIPVGYVKIVDTTQPGRIVRFTVGQPLVFGGLVSTPVVLVRADHD